MKTTGDVASADDADAQLPAHLCSIPDLPCWACGAHRGCETFLELKHHQLCQWYVHESRDAFALSITCTYVLDRLMPRTRRSQPTVGLPPLPSDDINTEPLYLRVARHIELAIAEERLSAGDRLDGEIGLAASLGVSRATMRKAIDEVVRQGLLVRRHGAGTQVLSTRAERSGGVEGLYDELTRSDRLPTTEVIALEVRAAEPDIASELWLRPAEPVLYVERIRLAAGVPIALMHNWLPEHLLDLTVAELEARGLYEILRGAGVRMRIAHQSVGAVPADSRTAKLLRVRKGSPMLSIETTTYADLGKPTEVGRHSYRGDMYRFPVTKVERQYGTEATR